SIYANTTFTSESNQPTPLIEHRRHDHQHRHGHRCFTTQTPQPSRPQHPFASPQTANKANKRHRHRHRMYRPTTTSLFIATTVERHRQVRHDSQTGGSHRALGRQT
ncbi:unnamed protein product, partial [Ectocarpus fasciculatus]